MIASGRAPSIARLYILYCTQILQGLQFLLGLQKLQGLQFLLGLKLEAYMTAGSFCEGASAILE
jgi:hypothetical protein